MNEFENQNNNPITPTGNNYYTDSGEDQPQVVFAPPTYNNYIPPQQPKKEKRGHSLWVIILACFIAAVSGVVSTIAITGMDLFNSNDNNITNAEPNTNTSSVVEQPDVPRNDVTITVDETVSSVAEAVAAKCVNSVVGIRTTTSVSSFFGGSQEQTRSGSGVVYTADGYIITNYHVIADVVESNRGKIDVFIGTNNTTSYPATVVGYNISCDLAVVKINVTGLTPVELSNSDNLRVGQYVVTIGSPGGLEFMGSVTYGIISGLDREVSTSPGLKLIQTDAAINPGNSGGALLDQEGKLIGINSAKIASVEYEGMGFAIPVNAVKEKCDKIISKKGNSDAYLGASISNTYTSDVLAFYDYPAGAVVSSVAEDSPAEEAGIKRGDIITEFNGVKITEYTVLSEALSDCSAGDTVKATIYRDGKYKTVTIKLASDTSN